MAGVTWTSFTSTPNGASLASIAALSSMDVWTVGLRLGGPCQYQTLTQRWNGTWTIVPSPNRPGLNSVLNGAVGVAPDDLWGVGDSRCPTIQDARTLIEHWNGGSWSIVSSPNPSPEFNTLHAVDAIGPNNAWAVGSKVAEGVGSWMALHWNGSKWRNVPIPAHSGNDELLSVSGTAASNVWAVGAGIGAGGAGSAHRAPSGRIRLVEGPGADSRHGGAVALNAATTLVAGSSSWAAQSQPLAPAGPRFLARTSPAATSSWVPPPPTPATSGPWGGSSATPRLPPGVA